MIIFVDLLETGIGQDSEILYINICCFLILNINMISKKDIKNLKMIRMLKKNNKLLIKFNRELNYNVKEMVNHITELIKNRK